MPATASKLTWLQAHLRAVKFILGSFTDNPKPAPALKRESTPGGTVFDRYIPASEPIRTVIVIYGISLAGDQDLRAIRIGSLLANLGLQAIVPVLPGLKSYRAAPGDYDLLVDLIGYLHQTTGKPVGMVASSIGGGIGLATAADPQTVEKLDFLILLSPYYDLPDFVGRLREIAATPPRTQQEWDDFTWSLMVAAYCNQDKLDFIDEEKETLKELLWNSFSKPLQPRIDFYERVLKNKKLFDDSDAQISEQTQKMLSPHGKLGHIKAQVIILHDTHDQLIRPEEAEKILAELQQRPAPHSEELLITPWINHVTPRFNREMFDMLKIVSLFANLFYSARYTRDG